MDSREHNRKKENTSLQQVYCPNLKVQVFFNKACLFCNIMSLFRGKVAFNLIFEKIRSPDSIQIQ